jgi:2-polyprenyl-3-methyl-5-hydroxy-6-metoxy-1,4-benzoquinol methylase
VTGHATRDERRRRAFQYENPREDVQAVVPREARRILDLGCSSGVLGAALKARQPASVVGVEIEPEYARDASARLDRVMTGRVEDAVAGELGELGEFDCIIAADVLEHLQDPWLVTRQASDLLVPGGSFVVSLPNVSFWETFWQVGRHGTWPRRDHGIFDRTHLRWFTYWDARAMLEQASLEVVEVAPQYRLKPEPSSYDRRLRFRDGTRKPGAFFAFQYVIRGHRKR